VGLNILLADNKAQQLTDATSQASDLQSCRCCDFLLAELLPDFLTRYAMHASAIYAKATMSVCLSVCLSICVSVTLVTWIRTAEPI